MKAIIDSRHVPIFSGIVTLSMVIVFITPLCGLLFQCGCDWPWAGFDTGCNYYRADERFHCPWCESMIMGISATGVSILSGTLVAAFGLRRIRRKLWIEIALRIASGLGVFMLIATLAALLAAWVQGYPLGIG